MPPLVQALLQPGIYPGSPRKVELVQTQMSLVFLTGDYVYKVKKPVNLGYLDYSTLEKRRFFCQEEMKLNRRFGPEVYLGVIPITQSQGRISLDGDGEVIEYAVRMRQLPLDRMMDVLLKKGQVTEEMIRAVARKVVGFHQRAETSPQIGSYGSFAIINTNIEENFTQTRKNIGGTIPAERYQRLKSYSEAFLQANAPLFDRRVKEGRVRDCHGDLHAAHICFTDGICIYDCIEFNERFRYCDVAAEVSFLAMDLDYHRHPDLSQCFVSTYVEASGDKELPKLLHFYKCYYAYVRGKVEGFKLDDPLIPAADKEKILAAAQRYFELAESYVQMATGTGI